MAVRNVDIILAESFELMKAGVLQEIDGLPETIHTYEKWKELGYQVRKGEHAIAKFPVWTYVPMKQKDDGTVSKSKMYMKNSSFFQVFSGR